MACSLDELDGVITYAEDTSNHNKNTRNVGAPPRESFLLVRKPTQRRLTPNPEQTKDVLLSPTTGYNEANSMATLHPEIRLATIETINVKSYQSSHEDEIKSSGSFSTDKVIGLFPSDRDMKGSIFAANKGSKFRISHFQQIEKQPPSRSSIPSLNKLDEHSMSLSVTNRRTPSQIVRRITGSFFSKARIPIQQRKSMKSNARYLRAINDKCDVWEDDISYHPETTDRRLRGLLKKHAIKRRRTMEMKDLVKKLKLQQSRTWISKIFIRLMKRIGELYQKLVWRLKKAFKPIEPNGLFINFWDLILFLFMIYGLLTIPVELCFDFVFKGFFYTVDWIESITFLFDILINFHTAFYLDGVLITKHSQIAINYLKSWFILDLLACLPFPLLVRYKILPETDQYLALGALRLLKIVRIIKVFRIGNAISKLKDFNKMSGELNGIIKFVRLWLTLIFLIHWVACIWHLIGSNPGDGITSWINSQGLENADVETRYIKSIYWSTATLLTVGYGDIVAVNKGEEIFSIFVMFLGSAVVGFSMNKIGDILQQINAEVNFREKKITELQKFMSKNNIDESLQVKAKQYIEFKFEHEKALRESDKAILHSLSHTLRDQMIKQVNGRIMKNNQLFQKSFGSSLLTRLAMSLEEQLLAPDEYLYKENDLESPSLYFVSRGRVEILLDKYKLSLGIIEKDSFLGELSFFTSQARESSARTMTFSSIFCLTFENFYEALEKFPSDKEMYHVLKDQVNLLQDYACIGSQCWLCGDNNHIAGYCPKAHLCLDKQEVIKEYLEKTQEFAKNFKRNNRPKYHALTKLNEVRKASSKILSLKNQITTSMTEVESTIHEFRKSRKQVSGPAIDEFPEGWTNDSEIIETGNPTLTPSGDDVGVQRFRKDKRFGSSRDAITKSITMKHQGEAAFLPMKVRIAEHKRQKIDEIVIDQVRNYEIYFPHNNLTKVIEQIECTKNKRKYFKTRLATEQDITQFKARLGKLFEKTKRMNSNEVLKSPINKSGSVKSWYIRKRSKSVKGENPEVSYARKRSGSVRPQFSPR